MSGAGEFWHRVAFEKRSATSDGAGGTTTAFAEQFVNSASYRRAGGSEAVMAGRLEGRHTQIVRVRASPRTRLATTDWRLKDTRTGVYFNIRDITLTEDRAYLDLLCESGVAT